MKKFIILALVAVLSVGAFSSCKTLDTLDGMSITTSDNLISQEMLASPEILLVADSMLPKEMRDNEKFKGKTFVLAPDEMIKKDALRIDLTPGEKDRTQWILDVLGFGVQVASTFFPQLAILEAFLALLSRRKRQAYGEAFRAVLPYDGSVDIKGAALAVGKAIGVSHSRPEPTMVSGSCKAPA